MLEVVKGGIESLIEDWPGRVGHLDMGIAASGAVDSVALGLANIVVGNGSGAAGIEIAGGYFCGRFTSPHVICIAGTDMGPTVNNEPVDMWKALAVTTGDEIRFEHYGSAGFRSYVAVAGGADVPLFLGSRSTCIAEGYGGFDGRRLKPGDRLRFGKPRMSLGALVGRRVQDARIPIYGREYGLRAIPGPNSCPDYVTQDGMDLLFSRTWPVSLASNRTACRLEKLPDVATFFARVDGGVGGGHPSNVLDHAYSVRGALNLCGDTPILLIGDAPTMGGYLNPLHVILADLWMAGQCAPGRDALRFRICTQEEATEARADQRSVLSEVSLA